MKVPLYLLGALIRWGPQHGYRLKQRIAETAAHFAGVKPPTIYYHLKQMAEDKLVEAMPDKEGGKQERCIFEITTKGRDCFRNLIQEACTSRDRVDSLFDAVLFFADQIPSGNMACALDAREANLIEDLNCLRKERDKDLPLIPEHVREAIRMLFRHHEMHIEAEIAWTHEARAALTEEEGRDPDSSKSSIRRHCVFALRKGGHKHTRERRDKRR